MQYMNKLITGILLLLFSQVAWAQCNSVKRQTFLVSDRYRHAARHDTHLLLANSHGLVFRNLDAPETTPLHIEPLSGDITHVATWGDYVFATALDEGIHVMAYETDITFPKYLGFASLPGLRSIEVRDDAIFAHQDGLLTYLRFNPENINNESVPLPALAELSGEFTQFLADDNLLYVRNNDGTMHNYAYDMNGLTYLQQIIVGGNEAFYGAHLASDRLVLDGLDGVVWATFTGAGTVAQSGSYYANQFGEIVLGSKAQDSYLFLRFADRIEVYNLSGDNKDLVGTISQEFQDVGHVALVSTDGYFHLLNQAPQQREWSLASYRVNNSIQVLGRLEALFEELVAGASIGERVFLASNRDIFLADVQNPTSLREQDPLYRFDGNIQDMVASDSLLFVTAPVPGTGFTQVSAFSISDEGTLVQEHSLEVSGSVSQLSQHEDTLAFLRLVRNTTEDLYEVNVLSRTEGGNFGISTASETVALGGDNPFQNLHLSDLGLAFLRNEQVWLYDNLFNLSQLRNLDFPVPFPIEDMVAQSGHFWLQTSVGIYLYALEGPAIVERGHYFHWRDIRRLPDNRIIAKNFLRTAPSPYHILEIDQTGIVNDTVDIATSDDPLFMAKLGEDILVGERASMNIFDLSCPTQFYEYAIPYSPELELELSTIVAQTDLVTMIIYNDLGEAIGFQDLDQDIIATFNGRALPFWLFDYNLQEEPATFSLISSAPLAPVVSGAKENTGKSRFAYRVPPFGEGEVYLPHFPKDLIWQTETFVRGLNPTSGSSVTFSSPSGNPVLVSDFSDADTTVVDLNGSQGPPWLRIQSNDLENPVGGFGLFSDVAASRSAAIPLVMAPSNYLILPHLAGRSDEGSWSGMVLANPNANAVNAALVGYNSDGVIGGEWSVTLPGHSSMVVSTEFWLDSASPGNDTQWMVVVPSDPIMGMVLYGNLFDIRFAGVPLTGGSSNSLLFPGIRTKGTWNTELQITNQDGVNGTLDVIAFAGNGEMLDMVEVPIGPNENKSLFIKSLFSNLEGNEIGNIQTIRILADTDLAGLVFRKRDGTSSLEAYTAFPE